MEEYVILDASALLALFKREKGGGIVRQAIERSFISAINYAEVASVLMRELTIDEVNILLTEIGMRIVPFDHHQAHSAAALLPHTKHLGLSLADRACLSLAQTKNLPVLTADKDWQKLEIGVEVRVIR